MTARDAGRTLLISTHLVDELEDVVDECLFLREGRVVCAGKKDEICVGKSLKERYLEIYGQPQPEGDVKHV